MNSNKVLLDRVNFLLELANQSLSTKYHTEDSLFYHYWVTNESFKKFESASLSFISELFGVNHPYYSSFKESVNKPKPDSVESGKGIMESIKIEIEMGWLTTVKGLVSAEIFNDFLETAEYLMDQKYKDAAAVITGSTLEEHLRQLCRKNKIPDNDMKNGKSVPKKADTLNNELAVSGIYNKLDQKNITAWLDLRNKAAHGHYSEYKDEQVVIMLKGVIEFMTRIAI